jgi:hypothetical protein
MFPATIRGRTGICGKKVVSNLIELNSLVNGLHELGKAVCYLTGEFRVPTPVHVKQIMDMKKNPNAVIVLGVQAGDKENANISFSQDEKVEILSHLRLVDHILPNAPGYIPAMIEFDKIVQTGGIDGTLGQHHL